MSMKVTVKAILMRAVLVLVLLAALVAFLLATTGLPGNWLTPWIQGRLAPGLTLKIDRIQWLPLGGLMAHNLEIVLESDKGSYRIDAEQAWLARGARAAGDRVLAIHLQQGSFTGSRGTAIPIAYVDGFFESAGDQLAIRNVDAFAGEGKGAGSIRGDLLVDLAAEDFQGTIETTCNPAIFADLMPTNLANELLAIRFVAPPTSTFEVQGILGQPESMTCRGRLYGEAIERNGVSIDLAHCTISFADNQLRFDDIEAIHDQQVFRGSMSQDFAKQEVLISTQSSADPLAMARFIHIGFDRWIEPYLPPHPTRIDGRVRVGYGTNNVLEIHGNIEGDDLGFRSIRADEGSCTFDVRQKRIDVSSIDGNYLGGVLSGNMASYVESSNSTRVVKVDLSLDDAAFLEVVRVLRAKEDKPVDQDAYAGRVEGKLLLSGQTRAFTETMKGEGTVSLRNGSLFSTRIGKGLAGYLSKLHPSLGPESRQKCSVTYKVEGRTIHILSSKIQGRLCTITGRGTYTLGGELDLRVQVKLFRDGLPAKVVQILTKPASKLLEFHCTGPLRKPVWRPANTPRKILRIFRGEEKGEEELPAQDEDITKS